MNTSKVSYSSELSEVKLNDSYGLVYRRTLLFETKGDNVINKESNKVKLPQWLPLSAGPQVIPKFSGQEADFANLARTSTRFFKRNANQNFFNYLTSRELEGKSQQDNFIEQIFGHC